MCREHAKYVLSYMSVLLDEYQYRRSRLHLLSKFADWAEAIDLPSVLPVSG